MDSFTLEPGETREVKYDAPTGASRVLVTGSVGNLVEDFKRWNVSHGSGPIPFHGDVRAGERVTLRVRNGLPTRQVISVSFA